MNAKGADPDDMQVGGAFVVVWDGESPLHGEGTQFNVFAQANYLTSIIHSNKVKTFDNQWNATQISNMDIDW